MGSKRSYEKRTTRELEVLRHMRMARRMSMNKAAKLLGISSSAIAHIEQGRMGLSRARLRSMLEAYKYSQAEFLEYLDGKVLPIDFARAGTDLIHKMSATQLAAIYQC